jgi:hypothetical protein
MTGRQFKAESGSMGHADGPRAFDKRSVRVALENADGIVLVASGSLFETRDGLEPLAYREAIKFAQNGRNRLCVLIETLPEQEEAWLALMSKHCRMNACVLFSADKDAPRGPNAAFFEYLAEHKDGWAKGVRRLT